MSKIKILFKDITKVVCTIDTSSIGSYDKIRETILEKSNDSRFKKVKVIKGDKFILKFDGFNVGGLNAIWNSDTYAFFLDKINNIKTDKPKFVIEKVDEYPKFEPPQYLTVFRKELDSAWEKARKEIEDGLKEIHLSEAKKLFIQEKKDNDPVLRENLFNELNINVTCNNCLKSNFSGPRYICSECYNFNLCNSCQERGMASHNPKHTFIIINNQEKFVGVDILQYNSIFTSNRRLFKENYGPFEIDIEIINNGEENLQGCFLSPIRFGKNYLGCVNATITDECKKGDKTKLKVLILETDNDDDNDNECLDTYEGYFRLMTEGGIPFGDILYIQVQIEDKENEDN
jgi:hypothetical protein